MRLRSALSWFLVPVLVLGTALAAGYWASARAGDTRAPLVAALDTLPDDTQAAGFTDWSRIREHLDLGTASTAAARAALNDDASLRDLTTRSVISRTVEAMHQSYGWSAADVDWEVYGQANDGAAMVARLNSSVSLSDVRRALRALNYVQDGRVWSATTKTPAIDGHESTLKSIAIIPGEHLVVAADRSTYVRTVLEVIDRNRPSLLSVRPVAGIAESLVGTDTALMQSGPSACAATSLDNQKADVRAQAAAAVARAGDLAPTVFAGRGLTDSVSGRQQLRFAMAFDSPSQASAQLRVRTALTTGPFIGRSGRVEDSLRLTDSRVVGSTATLRFDLTSRGGSYMVGSGPLLFASCGV